MKLVFGAGSLLILLIVFIVIKNIFTTSAFNKADYIAVVQQQEQINTILTKDLQTDTKNANLTTANSNFAVTAQLAIASDQTRVLAYLKSNHIKVSNSEISDKLNKSVCNQLSSSLTTNNFNQTFDQVMQNELTTYAKDLTIAYNSSHGVKGRALLKSEYSGIELLYKQISLPTS